MQRQRPGGWLGESAKRFAHVFAYMRGLLRLGMYEMGWVFQRVLSGCAGLVVSYL